MNFKRLIFRFFVSANIMAFLFLSVSNLSPFFSADKVGVIATLGLLFPMLVLVNVFFIIVWVFVKRKYALLSLIALFLSSYNLLNTISLSFNNVSSINNHLKVASFNMQFSKPLLGIRNMVDTKKQDEYLAFLKRNDDIEILCMQEMGTLTKPLIESAMSFKYQHSAKNKTIHIASKYPFVNYGELHVSENPVNSCLWADIKYKGDTIRVYSMHLESNRFNGVVPKVIKQDAKEIITPKVMVGLLSHYPTFSFRREHQVKLIVKHIKQCKFPIILTGDFNDIPLSHNYHLFRNQLNDSFSSCNGTGATIDSKLIDLRIDYILHSDHFKSMTYKSTLTEYSDHALLKTALKYEN